MNHWEVETTSRNLRALGLVVSEHGTVDDWICSGTVGLFSMHGGSQKIETCVIQTVGKESSLIVGIHAPVTPNDS